MKNYLDAFSCLHEGLSNNDVWVAKGTVFQETRPGADFKTGGFVEENLGGYRGTTPNMFLTSLINITDFVTGISLAIPSPRTTVVVRRTLTTIITIHNVSIAHAPEYQI